MVISLRNSNEILLQAGLSTASRAYYQGRADRENDERHAIGSEGFTQYVQHRVRRKRQTRDRSDVQQAVPWVGEAAVKKYELRNLAIASLTYNAWEIVRTHSASTSLYAL